MMNLQQPDIALAAVCGLYCPACSIYIAVKEDRQEFLERMAAGMNVKPGELKCEGCRSATKGVFCRDCALKSCAESRGHQFCSGCGDYPCDELKAFQQKMPHRAELWASLNRIREAGWEIWFAESRERHSCPSCQQPNGWYEMKCPRCGNEPGSPFAAENPGIAAFLKSRSVKPD